MQKIICPAKVNLALRIIDRDENSGYHFLESFVKKINFSDEMIILENQSIDSVKINFLYGQWLLQDSFDEIKFLDSHNNILIKAIEFFEKYSNIIVSNLEIFCKKNIPYGSGLGGGSSDAAEILKFLQKKYNFYFSEEIFSKITFELGSDVNLFFENENLDEILFIDGFGGDIKKIKLDFSFEKFGILIFFPYQTFESKIMYKKFKKKNKFDSSFSKSYRSEIFSGYNSFYNILQEEEKEKIDAFFCEVKKFNGLLSSSLSGSGSACFAIFETNEFAIEAKKKLSILFEDCFMHECNFC